MEPLNSSSPPSFPHEFSSDGHDDEDLETTLEKMGPNALSIFANSPSILQGSELDGSLKQCLTTAIECNFNANLTQKGYDLNDFPDLLKKRIRDNQQKYIDTIFAVFKNRIQEGDPLVVALKAMQERAFRWINNDDKNCIQDLLVEFGLQLNQQAQQKATLAFRKSRLRAKR